MRKRLGTVREVAAQYTLTRHMSHGLMMLGSRVEVPGAIEILTSVWDIPVFSTDGLGKRLSRLFGLGHGYPDELATHGIELNHALLSEEESALQAGLRSRLACEITSYVVMLLYKGERADYGWEWRRLVRSFGINPDKLPALVEYVNRHDRKHSEALLDQF